MLDDIGNAATIDSVRGKVTELCARFPVYGSEAAERKVSNG